MYGDGFVSSKFWVYVFCGMALCIHPFIGVMVSIAAIGLLGNMFDRMDERDHARYRRYKGYWD
jgi:hypothetical protein